MYILGNNVASQEELDQLTVSTNASVAELNERISSLERSTAADVSRALKEYNDLKSKVYVALAASAIFCLTAIAVAVVAL